MAKQPNRLAPGLSCRLAHNVCPLPPTNRVHRQGEDKTTIDHLELSDTKLAVAAKELASTSQHIKKNNENFISRFRLFVNSAICRVGPRSS
jgi:hypothetical protein